MTRFARASVLLAAISIAGFSWTPRIAMTEDDRPQVLSLLRISSQRYEQAGYYQLRITSEVQSDWELSRSWTRSYTTAIFAPGNRYRFETRWFAGGLLQVSDGKTEWIYQHISRQYQRHTAPVPGPSHFEEPMFHEQRWLEGAHDEARDLANLLKSIRSATYLDDETIVIGETPIACYVVRAEGRYHSIWEPGVLSELTLWIDQQRQIVRKIHVHTVGASLPFAGRPHAVEDYEAIFDAADLNNPAFENSEFTFTPPPHSKQVRKLRDPAHFPLADAAEAVQSATPTPVQGDREVQTLLKAASAQYTQARSYHSEAVNEFREEGDLKRYWGRQYTSAAMAPGNRYRLENRNDWAPTIQVSDGSKEWAYRTDLQQYIEQPANRHGQQNDLRAPPQPQMADQFRSIVQLANSEPLASVLPDQTLVLNGWTMSCHVVQVQPADSRAVETFWIEKDTLIVRKLQSVTHRSYRAGGESVLTNEITYPIMEFNIPDSRLATFFQFDPPAAAKRVEKFSYTPTRPELIPR